MKRTLAAAAVAAWMALGPLTVRATSEVDDHALADETQAADWPGYGRTYSEQRYSPLDQITDANVARLGVAWYLDLPEDRSLTGTPLAIDGVLYFNGSYSVVRAVDARTGKVLWTYDPKVIEHAGARLRVFWDWNRGIAYWKGSVFVATVDGRLIAIDGATGQERWSTQTLDPELPLFITGAPKVFRDKVVIGNGGTEWGAARGYVTAYDTATGKQVWRFYTVPGNPADGFENEAMKMAAATWTGEWWKHGGGGNVWHGITYDPEYNQVYLGTGNGSPWNRKIRSPGGGDNLFLCAVVALDADTGKYKWHYQTTPGETWDYNSSMDIMLADLTIHGEPVKVLLHAPKNGFFYILRRADGKLLSAEKFVHVDWATEVDLKTGRPVERPGARYEDGEELVWPSPFGGHNWHAMSFNPRTGLVYIPILELPGLFRDREIDIRAWKSPYWKFDPAVQFGRESAAGDAGTGALKAWDPIAQKTVWEVPLPGVWNPGTMTTAGNLVFEGRADGTFHAYRADTGETLWNTALGLGISAPPVTYAVDGRQYVALLVGWGGTGAAVTGMLGGQHGWAYRAQTRRLVTFALDATTTLPPLPPPVIPRPLAAPEFQVDAALAETGSQVFKESCMMCHGGGAVSSGYAPDLRASAVVLSYDEMAEIVFKGARRARGMPNFIDISRDDLKAVQHFIRQQASR